jgi:diguanylate cyclase (GGDEF)-like protein
MRCDRITIAPDTRVTEVERMLLSDPTIRSVLVETEADIICIDRVSFFSGLAGPLGHGRSLYARHAITRMPHPSALVLPSTMTPVEAAQAVLERPADVRYSDIVVRFPDGKHSTLLVADLFAEVAHTHEYTGLHDSLTGLPNRVLFLERLRDAHRRSRRQPGLSPYAILFVDLDDFKPINDVLGHSAGDQALRTVAERLQDHDLESVMVARLAGDEFGVLVDRPCSYEEVVGLAERVVLALNQPLLIDDATVAIGASVGFALAAANDTPEELLRKADMAMYAAKRSGKGSYAAYSDGMHANASRRLELRSQIDGAIDREEFRVAYQAVVELQQDTIVGAEALIRWDRPGEGLISPDQFIPICEQNGLIVPLGAWMLEQCCRRAVEWGDENPNHAPMSLSVNVSPRQLEQPGFPDTVGQILQRTRMPAEFLILEITENVLIQDAEAVLRRLSALKRLGVKLALDDFGAGFSSLGYLSRMPLDVLKLDRSFVLQMDNQYGRNLLNGIITLAHSLDLTTVAEGVETARQAEELRTLGCQRAQGYYFARPMPGEAYRELLGDASEPPTLPAQLRDLRAA